MKHEVILAESRLILLFWPSEIFRFCIRIAISCGMVGILMTLLSLRRSARPPVTQTGVSVCPGAQVN